MVVVVRLWTPRPRQHRRREISVIQVRGICSIGAAGDLLSLAGSPPLCVCRATKGTVLGFVEGPHVTASSYLRVCFQNTFLRVNWINVNKLGFTQRCTVGERGRS